MVCVGSDAIRANSHLPVCLLHAANQCGVAAPLYARTVESCACARVNHSRVVDACGGDAPGRPLRLSVT